MASMGSQIPFPSFTNTGHMNFSGPGNGASNIFRKDGVRRRRRNLISG
jgi:hypothetical protein